MRLERTIDEYLLKIDELNGFIKYLNKRRRFVVDREFPSPFMNGDAILDARSKKVYGYVIHHPWGGDENEGLYVFRDTRLESELISYKKLLGAKK
ncbi:MAG: hypothetical protein AABX48_01180 [Nanoarchaeota archaeon]